MTETELSERIAEITENGDSIRQIQSRKERQRNAFQYNAYFKSAE